MIGAGRKLIVYDPAWVPYVHEFAQRLGPSWHVVPGPSDLAWLCTELLNATALLAVQMPPEALPFARQLQVFLCPGAGLIQSDPGAWPAGCRVVNVYEHEIPIAEYVLMTMLAHVKELLPRLQSFRNGDWAGSGRVGGMPHGELHGRTVGIFGYGRIGIAVAARARAFGMRVAAVDRDPSRWSADALRPDFAGGPEQLPELLRISDFLVIAVPLTDDTRGRIGAAEIDMLPANAYLINVSRAEIVCEEALYEALASERLAGAALDVWYQYPASGNRGHGSKLPFHSLPNVICTPHYSGWTKPLILRRISRMAENLNRLSCGEQLEQVVLVGTWQP